MGILGLFGRVVTGELRTVQIERHRNRQHDPVLEKLEHRRRIYPLVLTRVEP